MSNGPNLTNSLSLALAEEFGEKEISDTQLSQQYAQQCYANDVIQNSTDYSSCDSQKDFRISRLPYDTTLEEVCPFSPSVCLEGVQTIKVRYLHPQKAGSVLEKPRYLCSWHLRASIVRFHRPESKTDR